MPKGIYRRTKAHSEKIKRAMRARIKRWAAVESKVRIPKQEDIAPHMHGVFFGGDNTVDVKWF